MLWHALKWRRVAYVLFHQFPFKQGSDIIQSVLILKGKDIKEWTAITLSTVPSFLLFPVFVTSNMTHQKKENRKGRFGVKMVLKTERFIWVSFLDLPNSKEEKSPRVANPNLLIWLSLKEEDLEQPASPAPSAWESMLDGKQSRNHAQEYNSFWGSHHHGRHSQRAGRQRFCCIR